MKFSPSFVKLLTGLGLLVVIAFGASAMAAGHQTAKKPAGSNNISVVALASLAIGVHGFRRKG